MVPQVDIKDTERLIKNLRVTVEAVRQEVLAWSFMVPNAERQGEAMDLHQLAARSAQQARQWMGRMLKELDESGKNYPYPNSSDSTTQLIDKTAVPSTSGLGLAQDWTTVQKIKEARSVLHGVTSEFEKLLSQCIPGSFFNQCLFRAQEFSIQTGMWLGELLAEFVAVPQAEPVTSAELVANPQSYEVLAPGNDAAPTLSTSQSMGSSLGAESLPAPSSTGPEAASLAQNQDSSTGKQEQSVEALAPGESALPVTAESTEPASTTGSDSTPGSASENDSSPAFQGISPVEVGHPPVDSLNTPVDSPAFVSVPLTDGSGSTVHLQRVPEIDGDQDVNK